MSATLLLQDRSEAERRSYAREVSTPGPAAIDDVASSFATGDEAALRAAYDEYGSLIYSFCRRSVGDERAKDVTQEVFVSAWRARDRFDPAKGTLGGWLMGIAKNRLIDNIRSEQRHSDRRANSEVVDIAVEADVGRVGDRMLVADALKSLPDRTRKIIELAYMGDLTHSQISEQTSIPLGTVKSDIRRGLAHIRRQMETSDD
jgi:RNA polymerase sigma factor (sigma-70 family)